MAKEGDLWDDSALINAFDDAISKYKMMHGKGHRDSSTEGGKVINSTEENLSAIADESPEDKRHIEADDNSNAASNITTEMGGSNNPPVEENHSVNLYAPQPYMDASNGQQAQDPHHGYSNTQDAENYTQLLNQYYELEEQRQKILQQLQLFGSWNYQGSGSSVHWGTCSASQEHQVPTTQTSYPAVICSCCPYASQCLVAPCSFAGTCVGKTCNATSVIGCDGKSFSREDGDIVKTAVGAAERALSSLKMSTPEKKEEKDGQLAQGAGSETDVTDVLNAWYSAGFYTGKYLVEQSIAKKHHG
ncbi:hypothetical protein F0562_012678 [Nyssa sinensis]|uniref:Survival Motor Neuron Gemin2-binding domain-containing protein n=1 Tax=Nyssa sinensis TaxID=561372 RepID=A0A5J4ZWF7_9ASTE|nr:hypothetical protein F0562_012678 [Nyssa sinensis]